MGANSMAIQKQSILIISHSTEISQYVATILTNQGYNVVSAETGKDGLSKAGASIDLVIVDTSLPDGNGLKLCHDLKMDAVTKHIPIIVIGGHGRASEKIESFHMGADDFIQKPVDWDDLVIRVETSILRNQVASKIHEDANCEMLEKLHAIVDQKNVIPFFQPIYQLSPLRLYGLEVLSRPQTTGILSNPEALFKVAMRFGCYFELEMIVWKKALEVAQKTFGAEHLFLNCSPHLIENNNPFIIKDVFEGFDMINRHVFLEVTERSAISVYDTFLRQVAHFKHQGFKIAVDDVGAGYSSLDVIMQTKPEVVKIDRHIVTGLSTDHFKRSLVRLIVEFCVESGIICIAEGIETKEDLDMVMELGVSLGQGYYFRKPSSVVDMQALRSIVLK